MQRQEGTGSDGSSGMLQLGSRDVVAVHDRVAPWVQRDSFGEELGAKPPAITGSAIDHKRDCPLHGLALRAATWAERGLGIPRTGAASISRHGP